MPLSRGSSWPRNWTQVNETPALQSDSLLSEPRGKPIGHRILFQSEFCDFRAVICSAKRPGVRAPGFTVRTVQLWVGPCEKQKLTPKSKVKNQCCITRLETQAIFINIEEDLTVTNVATSVLELMLDCLNKGLSQWYKCVLSCNKLVTPFLP